jgi:hypothetical protein
LTFGTPPPGIKINSFEGIDESFGAVYFNKSETLTSYKYLNNIIILFGQSKVPGMMKLSSQDDGFNTIAKSKMNGIIIIFLFLNFAIVI